MCIAKDSVSFYGSCLEKGHWNVARNYELTKW